jgi:hypothetical protein
MNEKWFFHRPDGSVLILSAAQNWLWRWTEEFGLVADIPEAQESSRIAKSTPSPPLGEYALSG